MAGTLEGFDPASFRAAIRVAMGIGAPLVAPVFHWADTLTSTVDTDGAGVPLDVDQPVTRTPQHAPRSDVACALDYTDSRGVDTHAGTMNNSQLAITLLDQDYAKVQGFSYVVVGGVIYDYERTDAPQALGAVEVYTVRCQQREA